MKKTDNYSLPQWEKQDFIKMEDFNDLTRKTDAALKANADATATGLNAETAARGGLRIQPGRGRVGVRLERRVGLSCQVVEILHLDEVLLLPLREGIVVGFFHVDPPIDKIGKANRLPYSFRL